MIDLTTLSADDLDALGLALSRERERRQSALDDLADADLLALHARICGALERRGILPEDGDRTGDTARRLLIGAYGWRLAEGGDSLVTPSGRVVSVRACRVDCVPAAGTFVAIAENDAFDMLACVALAADASILQAVLIERHEFLARAVPGCSAGTLALALGDALRLGHGAYDISAALAAAQRGCAPADPELAGAMVTAAAERSATAPSAPARPQRMRRRRIAAAPAARPPSLRAQLAASLALVCSEAETP